ncbi:hypothetical protein L1887_38349 [Cichorium endivia]|nr:hypothetical protein L1887_38349 [Cichorium endivia]
MVMPIGFAGLGNPEVEGTDQRKRSEKVMPVGLEKKQIVNPLLITYLSQGTLCVVFMEDKKKHALRHMDVNGQQQHFPHSDHVIATHQPTQPPVHR